MRRGLVLLLGLAACDRVLGISNIAGDAGGGDDVRHDQDGRGSAGQVCLGTAPQICLDAPDTDLVLSGSIDTGIDQRCIMVSQSGGPELCVLAGNSIDVNTFTGSGARALVLFATDRITIHASLSVASTFDGTVGAGANTICVSGIPPGSATSMGGGGGAGGSFEGMGGAGGLTGVPGVGAGGAGPSSTPTTIRGGCAGQAGGDSGGVAGYGGGALYLLAGGSIASDPNVVINASGGSGERGGNSFSGGGGGGSGGMIVLSAPTGMIDGQVFARGGGGGGGGGAGSVHGTDPMGTMLGGLGGSAGTAGGAGGPGCYPGSDAGGPGKAGQTGGGGGGGGCGWIRVEGDITFAVPPVPAPT